MKFTDEERKDLILAIAPIVLRYHYEMQYDFELYPQCLKKRIEQIEIAFLNESEE